VKRYVRCWWMGESRSCPTPITPVSLVPFTSKDSGTTSLRWPESRDE
jgi:hypothetical protein